MPHLYIAKNWFLEQQALKGLIRIDTHSLVSPVQAARLIICDAFFVVFRTKKGAHCANPCLLFAEKENQNTQNKTRDG